jgi:hypothetical protein
MVGADEPVVSAGRVHVTDTFALFVHVHPVPAADPNVTPAGRVSVTDTLAASDGPELATTSAYDTDPPAITDAGPDFTIDRSAEADTAVVTLDVLFVVFGSGVVADTVAVFDIEVGCAGAVTTTAMLGADAPVASAGLVQVTEMSPLFVQVQPAPVADTNVAPVGRVSVADSPAASEGPVLDTAS